MNDDKPKPVDDLKQGIGLLFRAAKGAVERLEGTKLDEVVRDGAKEVERAFENVAHELDKAWSKATGAPPPPAPPPPPNSDEPPMTQPSADAAKPTDQATSNDPVGNTRIDDAYAPEPPKGPRVG